MLFDGIQWVCSLYFWLLCGAIKYGNFFKCWMGKFRERKKQTKDGTRFEKKFAHAWVSTRFSIKKIGRVLQEKIFFLFSPNLKKHLCLYFIVRLRYCINKENTKGFSLKFWELNINFLAVCQRSPFILKVFVTSRKGFRHIFTANVTCQLLFLDRIRSQSLNSVMPMRRKKYPA